MSNDMVVGSIRSTATPPLTGGIYEALLEKAQRENEEQARLLGMSSEREARLATERDHYKQALEDLLSSTEKFANSHVPTNQSLDFIKQISRQIKKKLNNL